MSMLSRCKALHKKTVCFDVDVLAYVKVMEEFGGDGVSLGMAFSKLVASAVEGVKTTKRHLAKAEEFIRVNAEDRIRRRKAHMESSDYSESHVRSVGANDENLPPYALRIVSKLRDEGMTI